VATWQQKERSQWQGVVSSPACAEGVAGGRAESNPYAAAVMGSRCDIFYNPYAMMNWRLPKSLSGKVIGKTPGYLAA